MNKTERVKKSKRAKTTIVTTAPRTWRPNTAAAAALTEYREREYNRTGEIPDINPALNELIVICVRKMEAQS